jgi:hypothetical protein
MNRFTRFSPVLLLVFAGFAAGQSQLNVHFGLGTATNGSSGQATDTFGTGNVFYAPRMGGLFATTGAGLMLTPHFGIGGELAFRASQGAFSGLKYRPLFYDFNAIYQPHAGKRIVPEFQAGLGGVNMRFYLDQQGCDAFAGCSTASTFLESSNHFQLHFSAGTRLYVTPHIFFRPQFDVHWVNNFFQFSSNWVPQYTMALGYTFGER